MKTLKNRHVIAVMVGLLLATGFTGCKSKKAVVDKTDPAAERAKIEADAEALRRQEELLRQQEEAARLAAERAAKEEAPEQKLAGYFQDIATASSLNDANTAIYEALSLFTSPDALVLIIISEEGGVPDYDKPTTANKYLNYIKDQKSNANKIKKAVLDSDGKIKELELIKP